VSTDVFVEWYVAIAAVLFEVLAIPALDQIRNPGDTINPAVLQNELLVSEVVTRLTPVAVLGARAQTIL
jgi:hypothetical protein